MSWSRLAFSLTLLTLLAPVTLGLAGTLLPALGYFPALGTETFTLEPLRTLFSYPGVSQAMLLSLWSGLATTALSLFLSLLLAFSLWPNRGLRRVQSLFTPLLATPHAAMTIGLVLLIAPSGWLMRLVSPSLSGFSRPPDWLITQDPLALSLIAALTLKAVPYLLWMTAAALTQLDVERTERLGQSLGYSRAMTWRKLILPQLYPMLRLPIYAELAFTVSVVDVAQIIGPVTPPTFAVLLLEWFSQPELSWRLPASAGAISLLFLVLLAIGLWELALLSWRRQRQSWLTAGKRGSQSTWASKLPKLSARMFQLLLLGTALLGAVTLVLWSFAHRWRFPDALPSRWSLASWERYLPQLSEPLLASVGLALAASLCALLLVIGTLEWEQGRRLRCGKPLPKLVEIAFYLPLLLPQLSFLFGVQVLWLRLGIDNSYLAVMLSHLLFVLPYVWLSLAGPYRAYDHRFSQVALSLGRSRYAALWQIKLPMLRAPLTAAFTIGILVSLGQYLPTLFAGGGRITTLTTEVVVLAGSGNRKATGIYALLLVAIPLLLLLLPKLTNLSPRYLSSRSRSRA